MSSGFVGEQGSVAAPPAPPSPGTMAFIVGCGRSGTTILGTILSRHEDVMYLNDRFDLWIRPFGVTDIWAKRYDAAKFKPRVALTEEDAPVEGRARFYELLELERRGKQVLVEKLAINNFRIGFLIGLCPDAGIISIVRHGVEVAWSIEAKASRGHWYGKNDAKWDHLVSYAETHGYGHLLPLCKTSWDRALLEWRMSVEAAERYLSAKPPARLLRLRYEDLVESPVEVCGKLEAFLNLKHSERMHEFAREGVRRQSPQALQRPEGVPASTRAIAGETLERLGYSF
jgi:hypothetical protein